MGQKTVFFGLSLCLCICCIGCNKDFLEPRNIGLDESRAMIPTENFILDSIGVADEPTDLYVNAQEPYPEDILPVNKDYIFGSGDVVRISIYELREEGQLFIDDYVVTESGSISIPDVGIIKADGLTERELEEVLKKKLSPDILISPSIKVTLNRSESQLFSVEGQAVDHPYRYTIPRNNFRLLDALALAGGIQQYNVSYVYVTRQEEKLSDKSLDMSPGRVFTPSDTPDGNNDSLESNNRSNSVTEDSLFELITPSYGMGFDDKDAKAKRRSDDRYAVLSVLDGSSSALSFAETSKSKAESGQIEWVFENGNYVPVSVKKTTSTKKTVVKPAGSSVASKRDSDSSFGWDQIGPGGIQSRVIKIPVKKLFGGDPKYNIVIRSGDVVRVPYDIMGYYYTLGNLRSQGQIPLQGSEMTLVQAVAAANGLADFASPSKVEITRRIGRNRQVTVRVDLTKIAAGYQPDFYIKPNDTINVRSSTTTRFLAHLRGGFSIQTGMGYSRYFRDYDFYRTLDRFK